MTAVSLRQPELRLELVEPVELLIVLRALAADRPATARERAPEALAAYAFDCWRAELAPYGLGGGFVLNAFAPGRREIWLWVTGDRRWSQLGPWLTARVARRLADETASRATSAA